MGRNTNRYASLKKWRTPASPVLGHHVGPILGIIEPTAEPLVLVRHSARYFHMSAPYNSQNNVKRNVLPLHR